MMAVARSMHSLSKKFSTSDKLIEYKECIDKHRDDLPEIRIGSG
jgi:hypothetical protein